MRERLLRAARAAGRLDHPGLVTAYDVVTEGDVDHVVTELVEAPTLAERRGDRRAAGRAHGSRDGPAAGRDAACRPQRGGRARGRQPAHDPARAGRAGAAGTASASPRRSTRSARPATPRSWRRSCATAGRRPRSRISGRSAPRCTSRCSAGRPPTTSRRGLRGRHAGRRARRAAAAGAAGPADGPEGHHRARGAPDALPARPPVAGAAGGGRPQARCSGCWSGWPPGSLLAGPRVPTLTYGPGGDVGIAGPVAGACLATAPAPGRADHRSGLRRPACGGGRRDPRPVRRRSTCRSPGGTRWPGSRRERARRRSKRWSSRPDRAGLELMALVPAQAAFGCRRPGRVLPGARGRRERAHRQPRCRETRMTRVV